MVLYPELTLYGQMLSKCNSSGLVKQFVVLLRFAETLWNISLSVESPATKIYHFSQKLYYAL